ncbi:MAG: epoxyqueuosine reductase QueH [Alphaproteobacteria bacterium]|nr:epoxyqueuosine reductase QueH [Alphaproteobacteria bacterium]MCL2890071.1 epoxyqueuosine reductase QueH [Alphaproteobacteria bacterium]
MLKNHKSEIINQKLVLMSCCAPCSAGAIEQLKGQGADFCILFYNPNIFPDTEYQKRLAEQIKLCELLGVKYHVGDYNHDEWLNCVRSMENEPERGLRCSECFKMRIKWGADWARANGYDAIATVFGVSKHKDQAQVDAAALAAICDLEYIPINNQPPLPATSHQKFYRQNYCGCEYSMKKNVG